MKSLNLYILFIFVAGNAASAQAIKPYIAIVSTTDGKFNGILRQVTADALILEKGDSIIAIKAGTIKQIRIRASKKPYKYNSVLKYDPWADSNYEPVNNNNGPRVRKFGAKDPEPGEEITGHIANAAINGALNLIALPIHAINGNIDKIKINQDTENFKTKKETLTSYSTYYQANPDYEGELKKLTAISKGTNNTPVH